MVRLKGKIKALFKVKDFMPTLEGNPEAEIELSPTEILEQVCSKCHLPQPEPPSEKPLHKVELPEKIFPTPNTTTKPDNFKQIHYAFTKVIDTINGIIDYLKQTGGIDESKD